MKTRVMQSLLAASALALLGGCDTAQQPTTCRAAGGGTPFAAKFVPVTAAPGTACAETGRLLALGSYDPPGANLPTLAIGVEGTSAFPVAPDPQAGQTRLAQGEFSTKTANAQNTCSAPTLTPIQNASTGITYTFSNVEIYVSAANQGNQMKADLTITGSGCRATYKVVGLYPEITCEATADCRAEGTGINPDILESVVCDTTISYPAPTAANPAARAFGVCVLSGNDFVKTGGDQ